MVLKSYHQFSAAGWEAVLENFRERVRGKIAGNALHINKIKDYYLQTSSKPAVKRIQRIVNQNVQKSLRPPHDHQVASTSHTKSMSETIRQSKTRYSTKHASPELRKSSKFAQHAANLLILLILVKKKSKPISNHWLLQTARKPAQKEMMMTKKERK